MSQFKWFKNLSFLYHHGSFYLLFFLGFLIFIPLHFLKQEREPLAHFILKGNWEYAWQHRFSIHSESLNNFSFPLNNEWRKTDIPCINRKGEKHELIWFRVRLPHGIDEVRAIHIQVYDKPFLAFLNQEKVYSFKDLSDFDHSKFLGYPSHFIKLPPTTETIEYFYLLAASAPDERVGFCREILYIPEKDLFPLLFKNGFWLSILLVISLLISVIAVITAFLIKQFKPLISFVGMISTLALWLFCSESGPSFKHILIENSVFWSYLDLGSLFFAGPFLLQFYSDTQGNTFNSIWIRMLRVFAPLYFVHAILVTILSILGYIKLDSTLKIFDYSTLLVWIIMICDIMVQISKRSRKELIIPISFIMFISFALHDFFVGVKLLPWEGHISAWGIISVILGASIVAFHEVKQVVIRNNVNAVISKTIRYHNHDASYIFTRIKQILQILGKRDQNRDRLELQNFKFEVENLISDYENLAKDIAQKGAVRPNQIEMFSIIEIILESLKKVFAIGNSNKQFQLKYEMRHTKLIQGDRNKIGRIFYNILKNAQNFCDNNGVIWIQTKDLSRNRIQIVIGNTGSYVDEWNRENIFLEFFTKDKKNGAGFGLSIARDFVNDHNGLLECQSSKEKGTEFTFNLPTHEELLDPSLEMMDNLPTSSRWFFENDLIQKKLNALNIMRK